MGGTLLLYLRSRSWKLGDSRVRSVCPWQLLGEEGAPGPPVLTWRVRGLELLAPTGGSLAITASQHAPREKLIGKLGVLLWWRWRGLHQGPTIAPHSGHQHPRGWNCHSFSSLCLFNRSQMQLHHDLVRSNFDSQPDLFFIKENNQRENTKSHHLCSHTALYWQLQKENNVFA